MAIHPIFLYLSIFIYQDISLKITNVNIMAALDDKSVGFILWGQGMSQNLTAIHPIIVKMCLDISLKNKYVNFMLALMISL